MFCFGLDLTEAQLLPAKGSKLAMDLFIMDAVTTGLFTVELLMNVFAHRSVLFAERSVLAPFLRSSTVDDEVDRFSFRVPFGVSF